MSIQKDGRKALMIVTDKGNVPLQIARWTGRRAFIDVILTSKRIILPADAQLIELSTEKDFFIAFGDVTVDASSTIATDGSRLFLAGVQVVPVPLDSSDVPFTYIAVIHGPGAADGILQIEELE